MKIHVIGTRSDNSTYRWCRGWERSMPFQIRNPYLNVYLVDRCYGGPEEGGWWYDAGKLISSAPYFNEGQRSQIEVEIAELNVGRYPISSVLSTGRYELHVEDEPGKDFPVTIPHYE